MGKKTEISKDEIFEAKRKQSLTAVSFLAALVENLKFETAFKIAENAFTKYMIKVYEDVLGPTEKGSQERFDIFRKSYEDYAEKTSYCKIMESTSNVLEARFERCPFFEILVNSELGDLGYSFCLSDPGFTKELLLNVKFTRKYTIAKGGPYCDNRWEFRLDKE